MKHYIHKFFAGLSPVIYQKYRFYRNVGYWPNSKDPQHIREYLFKLKINSNNTYKDYVDKSKTGSIIKKIALENNMNLKVPEIVATYDNTQDIDFDNIREECFIKANHNSGMTMFYDPGSTTSKAVKQKIKNWLDEDYSFISGEKCYKDIQRKIIIEKPLVCSENRIPDDIKIHCFFGEPVIIQIIRRTKGFLERKTYNNLWEEQAWFKNENLEVNLDKIPKDELIEYSKILSKNFDYVRLDFYNINGTLYFGEYTFFPTSSHLPLLTKEIDLHLGHIYKELEKKKTVTHN